MRWFRHRIGLGVGLSLIAMALQLALTLGHTHAGELNGHDRAAAFAQHASAAADAPAPDRHHAPGDMCPDCLVIAQVAAGLTASPPDLPAQAAIRAPLAALPGQTAMPVRCRTGFQSRAPPRS